MSDKLTLTVLSAEPILTAHQLFHQQFKVTEKMVDGRLVTYVESREPVVYDTIDKPLFEIT